MYSSRLDYSYEFPRRLRIGLVGCGGQAFRNILPSLQYAPAELVATADVDLDRARSYARQFGAERSYGDHRTMLERERLDAVLFATGYDASGRPLYPVQAAEAMEAGCHAWIEKPPAASTAEIEALHSTSVRTGKQVGVGFMKMFAPSVIKVRSIIRSPEFGTPTTFYLRDPEQIPPRSQRQDLRKMMYLLDHIVHPGSVIHTLMGPVKRVHLEEEPGGAFVLSMKLASGACGTLHMPWGQSGMCPKERLEVIGQGANVVVENNVRVTFYRPGHPGQGKFEYGRIGDYTGDDSRAPLHWEMDGYSGQPMSMHLFYQGYAQSIMHFCRCILEERPIQIAGLGDAWHVTRLFEALASAGDGPQELPPGPAWATPAEEVPGPVRHG